MAKIITTGIAGELNGRLGGVVFQNGPAGRILRIQPRQAPTTTAGLSLTQCRLAEAAHAYDALTPTVKTYWTSLASNYGMSTRPGMTSPTAGRNLFIRWYTLHYFAGVTPTETTPSNYPFFNFPYLEAFGPDIDPPNLIEIYARTPIKWTSFKIQARKAPLYPVFPKHGKWFLVTDYTTGDVVDESWTWNSTTGLWHYAAKVDTTKWRRLAKNSVESHAALRFVGVSNTGQVTEFSGGRATLRALPW